MFEPRDLAPAVAREADVIAKRRLHGEDVSLRHRRGSYSNNLDCRHSTAWAQFRRRGYLSLTKSLPTQKFQNVQQNRPETLPASPHGHHRDWILLLVLQTPPKMCLSGKSLRGTAFGVRHRCAFEISQKRMGRVGQMHTRAHNDAVQDLASCRQEQRCGRSPSQSLRPRSRIDAAWFPPSVRRRTFRQFPK
jgi:hypothetical protein